MSLSCLACPFRKSYPDVLVVQPGQDWDRDNDTGPLDPAAFERSGLSNCSTLQNLFCANFFIPRFDLGLVAQNHVQQGIMDFQFSVVFDKTQFAELVHEKAYARSSRADHLRQRLLTDLSQDRVRLASVRDFS